MRSTGEFQELLLFKVHADASLLSPMPALPLLTPLPPLLARLPLYQTVVNDGQVNPYDAGIAPVVAILVVGSLGEFPSSTWGLTT